MQTFRDLERALGLVPAAQARTLGEIDSARGREQALQAQRPERLASLATRSRLQSTEASNAIEGVRAPRKRLRALSVAEPEPRNRSEAEIAGYHGVLGLIHESAADIPFTPQVVLQLHRDLYRYTAMPGGRWKSVENVISGVGVDGEPVEFTTLPASEVPTAMDDLHERFVTAREVGGHHPLLLAGAYVFDFLAIHPFLDGNGRMARLLTLLLLFQSGYAVGRWVSVERLISESRESYYRALAAAGEGWHDGRHSIWPWLEYFLGVMRAAYREFEERARLLGEGRGAKTRAIEAFIEGRVGGEFTVAEVRDAALGASDSHISKVLARLRREGVIESLGRGRSARWRRR